MPDVVEKPKKPKHVRPQVFNDLAMFVIYANHPEHPDFPFVVQKWTIEGPTDEFYSYTSILDARTSLGARVVRRFPRAENDHPTIVETWI